MTPNNFIEHFATFAAAPNGVAKLRELILQLAVQGKLVPQDENDEPASELIDRIAGQQRERSELETPFAVPANWAWCRISEITTSVQYGYTASADASLTDVRLLRITDIQNNVVDWPSVPGCQIDEDDYTSYAIHDNDIVIARTGGTIGKSYIVEGVSVRAVFASYLIRVVPSNQIFAMYLKRFLESPSYWTQLRAMSAGTGQPNVNGTSLKSLLVPLPPLAEQRRIVGKVDQLLGLCDELASRQESRRAARSALVVATLDRLTSPSAAAESASHAKRLQDHFDLLFDSPTTIPHLRQAILQLAVQGQLVPQDPNDEPAEKMLAMVKAERELRAHETPKQKSVSDIMPDEKLFHAPQGWEWARFGDLCLYIEAGWSPQCESRARIDNEWGVLKISAVTWGTFNPTENKALPANIKPRVECEVRPNDFLITRANTAELVAKSVVVEKTPPHLLLNDKTLRVVFPDCVDRRFVNLFNNCSIARSHYMRVASGTSESMRNVSRANILEMPIPVPPMAEQKRIVSKVTELLSLCDALESQLRSTESASTQLLASAVNVFLGAPKL